jgi:hypothetical protein
MIDFLFNMHPISVFILGATAASVPWMVALVWVLDKWQAARIEPACLRQSIRDDYKAKRPIGPFLRDAVTGYYVHDGQANLVLPPFQEAA